MHADILDDDVQTIDAAALDELVRGPESETEEQDDLDLARQCRIALGPQQRIPVTLTWNSGKLSVSQVRSLKQKPIVLDPQKRNTVVVELWKAQCWFGPFTIPVKLKTTNDEKARQMMAAVYHIERQRALDLYDYPRPRKIAEGVDPIGRHRFPDIVVTVIEPSGEEWKPIRLHQLYGIGDWDPLYNTDPKEVQQRSVEEQLAAEKARNEELKRQLDTVTGKVEAIFKITGAKHN